MAIDFSQVFRGVATGAMSAYNDAVVAKDRQYAELAVRAGDNYLNNILPETRKAEENRKDVYDRIASDFGNNFAELMDINKITTLKDGYEQAAKYYQGADKDALEAAMFDTSYDKRYQTRGKSFNEKYEPVRKYLSEGIGTMGPYTIDSLVGETEEKQPPMRTAMVSQKDPMTDTVTEQEVSVPGEFSSTAIRDFVDLSKIGDEEGKSFSEGSQYRLRLNDTTQAAFSNVGLDGQFYMKGDNLITQFDEASRNKGILTQELITNRFTPEVAQNAGYLNVATQVANEMKTLESATAKFKTDTDNLFLAKQYSSGSVGANNDETYVQFVLANQKILNAYGKGSIAYKRFIREKFNALTPSDQGYYAFFERFDKEVDAEEM